MEILSRFAFDLEVDECEVFFFSCGRFLAAGIGFEIEWVASADFSMVSTPPQFRGFSWLLVYTADDAIRGSLPKRKLKAMRNLGLRPGIQAVPQ
ncbi:MAG: hypothetical protein ACT4OT_17455 [Acidobacteriota bacterium]